jgi:hypothetical protein
MMEMTGTVKHGIFQGNQVQKRTGHIEFLLYFVSTGKGKVAPVPNHEDLKAYRSMAVKLHIF